MRASRAAHTRDGPSRHRSRHETIAIRGTRGSFTKRLASKIPKSLILSCLPWTCVWSAAACLSCRVIHLSSSALLCSRHTKMPISLEEATLESTSCGREPQEPACARLRSTILNARRKEQAGQRAAAPPSVSALAVLLDRARESRKLWVMGRLSSPPTGLRTPPSAAALCIGMHCTMVTLSRS